MEDTNIKGYMKIVNAIKGPIFTLTGQNEKYGTGFDLWRTGENQITLELMNACGKYGEVIDSIVLDFNADVSSADGMGEPEFVSHVVFLFERQLFEKQAA